ncbi:hypothetical protein TRVL_04141 [Trypanosoma vivax]|nr:hypothetical protein TRVL_04141 [Trypanosoma vivax]
MVRAPCNEGELAEALLRERGSWTRAPRVDYGEKAAGRRRVVATLCRLRMFRNCRCSQRVPWSRGGDKRPGCPFLVWIHEEKKAVNAGEPRVLETKLESQDGEVSLSSVGGCGGHLVKAEQANGRHEEHIGVREVIFLLNCITVVCSLLVCPCEAVRQRSVELREQCAEQTLNKMLVVGGREKFVCGLVCRNGEAGAERRPCRTTSGARRSAGMRQERSVQRGKRAWERRRGQAAEGIRQSLRRDTGGTRRRNKHTSARQGAFVTGRCGQKRRGTTASGSDGCASWGAKVRFRCASAVFRTTPEQEETRNAPKNLEVRRPERRRRSSCIASAADGWEARTNGHCQRRQFDGTSLCVARLACEPRVAGLLGRRGRRQCDEGETEVRAKTWRRGGVQRASNRKAVKLGRR